MTASNSVHLHDAYLRNEFPMGQAQRQVIRTIILSSLKIRPIDYLNNATIF
jgi:hypothetical protein